MKGRVELGAIMHGSDASDTARTAPTSRRGLQCEMRRRCAKEPPWRIDLRLMRLVYAENIGRTLEKMFAECDQFASDQGGLQWRLVSRDYEICDLGVFLTKHLAFSRPTGCKADLKVTRVTIIASYAANCSGIPWTQSNILYNTSQIIGPDILTRNGKLPVDERLRLERLYPRAISIRLFTREKSDGS